MSVRPRHPCAWIALLAVLATTIRTEAAIATDITDALQPILAPQPVVTEAQSLSRFQHWSGLQIMREAKRRHEHFPYVFEEQTMVLIDAQGNRSVRKLRRFSRTGDD